MESVLLCNYYKEKVMAVSVIKSSKIPRLFLPKGYGSEGYVHQDHIEVVPSVDEDNKEVLRAYPSPEDVLKANILARMKARQDNTV